jgi:hypothetical protein
MQRNHSSFNSIMNSLNHLDSSKYKLFELASFVILFPEKSLTKKK